MNTITITTPGLFILLVGLVRSRFIWPLTSTAGAHDTAVLVGLLSYSLIGVVNDTKLLAGVGGAFTS
jgi:hypothetical protein